LKRVVHQTGEIKNSFISTALNMSIPSNAIMSMIRAFSYDVDFQRDIKAGDKMEVVMEKFYTEDGQLSHTGNVLYSSLALGDKKISIYHFTHPDGQVSFYNEKGESIKKEFLRTPVNAAKISSKFGQRNHPVLGYTRMHKGVDFAAPIGTPILAAGGGVIEKAGVLGGYGKYIRIKHNSTYSTVYAHASRFAKGIKPGVKVAQGQVVAYVGVTGITSGPHLHYEVLERGKQINPLKFKFASSNEKLTGKLLDLFKKNKQNVDKILLDKSA
jgi:murein DD-endopeptidase MepM/ murein hydrolase activator NlpD